ncbi:hypothetical protein [Gordonia amicalis]|uniref:hypothetical protein n=1 Tax=Gordonia amicalis TaxID=89053 RepID=UPI0002A64D71|nr:hypothetical protein [Gordonia amicalis]MBA5845578.1 hypothetical protein [Gordonia amicalis]MDV7175820.1 hypothetical protein [Gordonia amicalis]NKX79915.1 hypothetical protein [Gordonia amicalis]UOG21983.1 hypothetical protein MTX80_02370 [Gordonia amicalis]GAC55342.1 hypothetical protein GOAMI_51_00090 [Gordonia amicalis NBRC 100051 = JCM 11271]
MPFSDDDLESFYREIEARTAFHELMHQRPIPRPERRIETVECPTPDKLPFSSPADALDGIDRIKRRAVGALSLRYYECMCGVWHITSSARLTYRPIPPEPRRRQGKKKR